MLRWWKDRRQTETALETRQNLEARLIYGSYPEVVMMENYERKTDYLRDIDVYKRQEKFIKIKNLKTIYQGREIKVAEVGAIQIAIVEDIEDFRIGDYLGAKPCLIQGLSHQHPAHACRTEPRSAAEPVS